MATALTAQALVDRHQASLNEHQPIPTFEEIVKAGGMLPQILIISCADPRCIPENIFKLQTGEAVVLRTAGGNAEHMLNPLLAIDSLLKFTEVLIVQHTDCGGTMFRDASIKEGLKERAPALKGQIDGMVFHEITVPLQESVKQSMAYLKESPLIREELKSNIRGFVFDIKTGELKEA